jgi:hypothetical protein
MRVLLFSVAVIAGAVLGSFGPATATPLAMSGLSSQSTEASLVENIGWRRQIRRYGYPVPYAYYPPAYGYYAAPPAAYYPPAYDAYAAPAYESYAPPPVAENGEYAAEGDYGDYPPANGEYGDYPPPDGY